MSSSRNLLDPRAGGVADAAAVRCGRRHPATAAGAALVGGYVVVASAMMLIGLLLTKVLVDHGVGSFDQHISVWFVDHRTQGFNDLTKYVTYLANTEPVVAIAAVVTGVLLVRRRWREAIFLVSSLVIEVTVFLSVTYVIARPRPDVERLNATPGTSGFPSGHAAASVVLWVGIAIVVTVVTTNVLARVVAWLPVAVMTWLVPLARVYRGMHYTTDVIAGLLLGVAALCVGCFVARTWSAAVERRRAADPLRDASPLRAEMAGVSR